MKSAIYLNEGTTQVVLTPENEWEKSALKFYECQGGWYRQPSYSEYQSEEKNSLIFRIEKPVTLKP